MEQYKRELIILAIGFAIVCITGLMLLFKSGRKVYNLTEKLENLNNEIDKWKKLYSKTEDALFGKESKNKLLTTQLEILESTKSSDTSLPSYIKGNENNRVDTKLFNKLRIIGCENNLIPEILQYLRDVYRIHIYSYGYNGLIQICAIESEVNSYIVNREETTNYNPTYYDCIINGIEEALLLIQDYKLQPNLENRNKINKKD